jgi:hypothetical protein
MPVRHILRRTVIGGQPCVIVLAVSIGHSFILITLTSARVCVDGDMVVRVTQG